MMLYNAMNLNTQKEVIKAARPSLSKQMQSRNYKDFCASSYVLPTKMLAAVKHTSKPFEGHQATDMEKQESEWYASPNNKVVGMSSELSHHQTSVLFGLHVVFQQRF